MGADVIRRLPRAERRAYPTERDVKRYLDFARDQGFDIVGIKVTRDGAIELLDARAIPAAPPADEFERWKREGRL